MNESDVHGVVIDQGPQDWQILQQGSDGTAVLRLAGRYRGEAKTRGVHVKLTRRLEGKAFVHGAFGRRPHAVPVDQPRNLPMLRFHGVPVE